MNIKTDKHYQILRTQKKKLREWEQSLRNLWGNSKRPMSHWKSRRRRESNWDRKNI